MFQGVPFSQYEELADKFIRSEYPGAFLRAFLLYGAILAFTVGGGIFLYSLFKNKSAYISAQLTDKVFHYLLMVLTIVYALWSLEDAGSTALLVFTILSAILAVAGATLSLFKRLSGVLLTLLSVWTCLPLRAALMIPAVCADQAEIGRFNAASKFAVFAADRMILSRVASFMLIASAVTLISVVYYTKRRYMFVSARARHFSDVSRCPRCREPLVSEDAFCGVCGQALEGLERSVPAWKVLDRPKHCTRCGKSLNNGICASCDPAAALRKSLIDLSGGSWQDKVKSVLFTALAVLLLVVPSALSNVAGTLTYGSVQVNNQYVEKLREWRIDPSLSDREAWVASYDGAAEKLNRVNARIFEIDTVRISYRELYVYAAYAEASYGQMEAVRDLSDAVHASDPSRIKALTERFDETIDRQQDALIQGALLKTGFRKSTENALTDGIRFYLSFIPSGVFVSVLFAAGAGSLIAGVVLLKKKRGASPLLHRAPDNTTAEEKALREQKARAYIKNERILSVIGAGIACVLIAVPVVLTATAGVQRELTVDECLHAAFTTDGTEIAAWLSQCGTDPDGAKAEIGEIRTVIRDARDKLDLILQSPDADDEVRRVSSDLKEALTTIESALDAGRLPDRDTIVQATKVLIEGMKLDAEGMLGEGIDKLLD